MLYCSPALPDVQESVVSQNIKIRGTGVGMKPEDLVTEASAILKQMWHECFLLREFLNLPVLISLF